MLKLSQGIDQLNDGNYYWVMSSEKPDKPKKPPNPNSPWRKFDTSYYNKDSKDKFYKRNNDQAIKDGRYRSGQDETDEDDF